MNEDLQTMADLELAELADQMNWETQFGESRERTSEVFEELIKRFREKIAH